MLHPIPLVHALYVSWSDPSLRRRDLTLISALAERHNWSQGITGTLLYTGEHFAQWLEGPAPAVEALLGRIGRDRRHRGMQVLRQGPIQERRFAEWGMRLFEDPGVGRLLDGLEPARPLEPAQAATLTHRILTDFVLSDAWLADSLSRSARSELPRV